MNTFFLQRLSRALVAKQRPGRSAPFPSGKDAAVVSQATAPASSGGRRIRRRPGVGGGLPSAPGGMGSGVPVVNGRFTPGAKEAMHERSQPTAGAAARRGVCPVVDHTLSAAVAARVKADSVHRVVPSRWCPASGGLAPACVRRPVWRRRRWQITRWRQTHMADGKRPPGSAQNGYLHNGEAVTVLGEPIQAALVASEIFAACAMVLPSAKWGGAPVNVMSLEVAPREWWLIWRLWQSHFKRRHGQRRGSASGLRAGVCV